MADGGHGGAEYPCCFCVNRVVVASSSRLPLSCFGGVERSSFPPKPPDTGKQMTMSICVIFTTPSSRHCHCQRRLHCTAAEVLPLPSSRAYRVPLPPPPKIKPTTRWVQYPPPLFFAAMIYHSLYLKADCCIVVGVACWIDVVVIITSPPSQTSCSEQRRVETSETP